MTFPLLSTVTFLPLAGALLILLLSGGDDVDGHRNARWIALVDDAADVRGVAADLVALRSLDRPLPVPGGARLARAQHQVQDGRRRHLHAVRDPDHVPDAAVHHGELGVDRDARQGIHDRLPRAGNADDRRLLRARHGAVLSVLRGGPDPDVPDHRHLGRQAPRLRQFQVLPLHAARLGADAAGHDVHVLAGRHDRHPDPARLQILRRKRSGGCGWRSSPRSR